MAWTPYAHWSWYAQPVLKDSVWVRREDGFALMAAPALQWRKRSEKTEAPERSIGDRLGPTRPPNVRAMAKATATVNGLIFFGITTFYGLTPARMNCCFHVGWYLVGDECFCISR